MAYTTIDKPSEHFNVTTWTADDSSPRSLTGFGHKPDFLFGGHRNSGSTNPNITDSSRGGNKNLTPATTAAEDSGSHGIISSFDTDGITITDGTNATYPRLYYNELDPFGSGGGEYVYWHWKANEGTTSSNTDGSITTTVQANTTAGFSIVLYTSASGAQTIGHGLGGKPDFYIIKKRNAAGDDWFVYHTEAGAGNKLRLSGTTAVESDTNIWQNTEPTSTVAYLQNDGGGVNVSSGGVKDYVGYFFRNIKGYSKFGKFIGNNSSDGCTVFTGFKPRWLMVKNGTTSHANHDWIIFDSKRERVNLIDTFLKGNSGDAETTSGRNQVDFLSNGFKARSSYGDFNGGSGDNFYYAAFAEHPFVTSTGVPTTAK